MHNSITRILIIVTTILFLASTALATEPAVSKINGKSGLTLGAIDGDTVFMLDGSVAFPLNDAVGLQVDVGLGEWDAGGPKGDVDITRLGLHLFARNPQLGLAGIYASRNELESTRDFDINQYAVTGEYYKGPLTFAALLGQNGGDADDDLLGTLDLRWYLMDELMVEIGTSIIDRDKKFHIGAEYQLLQSLASYTDLALAAYTDLAIGNDSYDHALIGLRAYFGSPKSLAKRHREDSVGNSTDRLNPPLLQ